MLPGNPRPQAESHLLHYYLAAECSHSLSDDALRLLGIRYEDVSKAALFLAAQAFLVYRQRGGGKTAPLPDFFIGAHAAALGIPIITRDVGRYRTYFPGVELICP
jgi:hypothetical protein